MNKYEINLKSYDMMPAKAHYDIMTCNTGAHVINIIDSIYKYGDVIIIYRATIYTDTEKSSKTRYAKVNNRQQFTAVDYNGIKHTVSLGACICY